MEIQSNRKTFYIGQVAWSVIYTALSFYYFVTHTDYAALTEEGSVLPDGIYYAVLLSFGLYLAATAVQIIIGKLKLKDWSWRDISISAAIMFLSVPVGALLLIAMFRIFN